MTSGNMSTDNMSNDAWLQALRSDPSPLFKAQLRERLRAQEPAAETRRDWPRRALVAAAAVVAVAVLISVPGVRASLDESALLEPMFPFTQSDALALHPSVLGEGVGSLAHWSRFADGFASVNVALAIGGRFQPAPASNCQSNGYARTSYRPTMPSSW